MMTVFSTILAVIKAIPIVQNWVEQFFAWYVSEQIAQMKAEIRDGIRKAIQDHDQRDLEKAIGNPNAGEPSGIPGTEFRKSLPGV